MDSQAPPNITSFIIRFVQSEPKGSDEALREPAQPYRGTIRHIQSDQEIAFTHWSDVVQFIRRYVQIESEP